MKKLLKAIAIMLVLFLSVIALSGCGTSRYKKAMQKIENEKEYVNQSIKNIEELNKERANRETVEEIRNKAINNATSTNANSVKPNTTRVVDKTPVDIKNNASYYFVIKGTKYSAGDKISSLSNSGYRLNKAGSEKDLQPNGYLIGGDAILGSDDKTAFYCTPFNGTKEHVKGADASIGSFYIDESLYTKLNGEVEITNGISIGTSLEDIEAIFGEPTSKTEATEYNGPSYTYTVSGQYKTFTFGFDKDNKVKTIRWQAFIVEQ